MQLEHRVASASTLYRSGAVQALREAALDHGSVVSSKNGSLSPHGQYRYPARFAPRFAAAALELVTQPNDLVLDPFLGSGATLIEAMRHGRRAVGIDISPISTFIAGTLCARYKQIDLDAFVAWFSNQVSTMSDRRLHLPLHVDFPTTNLEMRRHWRLASFIDKILRLATSLPIAQERLVRLVLLRSAQWTFDNRQSCPTYQELKKFSLTTAIDLALSIRNFREHIFEVWGGNLLARHHTVLHGPSEAMLRKLRVSDSSKFDAIVTSPPYPGVHMLYGRWQVHGRRETDLPLWIVGAKSVLREGDYTMHARRDPDNATYFRLLSETMAACREKMKEGAWSVHMVGFSSPRPQLTQYLRVMEANGFHEVRSKRLATWRDGRLWRTVPNRRWYAASRSASNSTKSEVVLLFRAG